MLIATALLAACSSHTGMSVGSGSAGAGGTASLHIHTGPAFGAFIGLGFIAAVAGDEGNSQRLPPDLDPTRRVLEQDCLKPIADPSANLRCR